jgi:tyrosyl-tRNA synthetase
MNLYEELSWRGLVAEATEGVADVLARETVTGYIGFDPTASSLHVGNLLVMTLLARLQRHGHSPIALVGGGTGLIGDPSGKSAERQLLTEERVDENVRGIRGQLARFLDFDASQQAARLVNNGDWLTKLGAIEFMRDVGKHFTVNAMVARESVKRRMESEDGISYTEFSYSLLQAYDFLMLYERYQCTLQMGGSDQYGNILAGMDLIRRVRGGKAHGLVAPLITTAAGAKFGKTEAGTVWLDARLTPPYAFYQFWLQADDRDAARYLRFFTFLDRATIDALEMAHGQAPEKRQAQRELAREVTALVHGREAVEASEAASAWFFGGDVRGIEQRTLQRLLAYVPYRETAWRPEGWRVPALVVEAGLAPSMGEATRLVRQKAVQVNGELMADEKARLEPSDAIAGLVFVVRKGRDVALVRLSHAATS